MFAWPMSQRVYGERVIVNEKKLCCIIVGLHIFLYPVPALKVGGRMVTYPLLCDGGWHWLLMVGFEKVEALECPVMGN